MATETGGDQEGTGLRFGGHEDGDDVSISREERFEGRDEELGFRSSYLEAQAENREECVQRTMRNTAQKPRRMLCPADGDLVGALS